MDMAFSVLVVAGSVLLLLLLLFIPLLLFLVYGWDARRRQIVGQFPDGAVALYQDTYFPALQAPAAGATPESEQLDFGTDFDDRYGRKHFLVPGLLLLAIAGPLIYLGVNTALYPLSDSLWLLDLWLPPTVVAAVAGAYMWVVYDFVVRERSLDFGTTHVNRAAFRFMIAVPLAYAIPTLQIAGPGTAASAVAIPVGVPLAILLGAFPTDSLMWLIRRKAADVFHVDQQADRPNRLENLPSVDTDTADRIRIDGISSIGQLADADPIAFTIRTGLSFGFVIDCLSEALAWHYLGQKGLDVARLNSAPGALEIFGLIAELDYTDNPRAPDNARALEDKRLAQETLAAIAKQIPQMEVAVLERTFRSICADSRVGFLARLMDEITKVRTVRAQAREKRRPAA